MNRKYSQTLAILFGILAPFSISLSVVALGIIYFLGGCLFGYLWPDKSWRWGFWLAGPVIAVIVFSVGFAGPAGSSINDIVLPLCIALLTACIGSFAASFARQRHAKNVSSGSI